MNLQEALTLSRNKIDFQKQEITEDRLYAILPELRKIIAFWREYPDYYIDYLRGDNPKNFNLFFYQRMFLRAAMRYRNFYAVYPRAYSKSFLSIMVLMIRASLYPGAQLFITSAGKEQSASIAKEKVNQICDFLPGMQNEIDWNHRKEGRDMIFYPFKNGSSISIVAMKQSTRGRRKTAGLIEEAASLNEDDANTLQEVIVPSSWGLIA